MTSQEQEEQEVRGKLKELAKLVDKQLPIGWGFALLCFTFGEEGRMTYVANAKRSSVVRAMYEFIEATKEKYGEDVPDLSEAAQDTALGRARQRIAELERELELSRKSS